MTIKTKTKSHPDADYLKELPFYNKAIGNIDLLSEVPFHEELSKIKTNKLFRGHAKSLKVEIIEKKDPINQLEASKLSIF